MYQRFIKGFVAFILLFSSNSSFGGTIVLGLNLEFLEGEFSSQAYDGGLGFHMGYEFKSWEKWKFGAMFESINGWNDRQNLGIPGEMMYDSRSLYATARPENWPIMFKLGVVDADYTVLVDIPPEKYRNVNKAGYGYGVALVYGNERYRFDLLDVKKIKIGSDTFTSYSITIAILMGFDYQ